MTVLKIPVERLREGPLELEVHLRPEALDLVDEEFTFDGPVTGAVTFHIVGNDVLAHGTLQAHAKTQCVRCLQPARVEINAPVDETWLRNNPEEEDVDREFLEDAPIEHSYTGDEIEVDEVFRELIMAELPIRALCQPECKGLCPGCGADLNTEACQCAPAVEAPPVNGAREPEWKQALKKIHLDPNG